MSDMTDVINIDLASDVSGAMKAKSALEQLAVAAHNVQAQFEAGAISEAKFNAEMDRLQASANKANVAFEAAMGGTTKLGNGLSSASGKMLQFGRLLDDAQYIGEQGLRPVIGQIMELSPAIGTALLAGQSLYKNWDSLASIFTGPAVKTAAQEMEELAQKTKLTADEQERLNRAKRLQDAGKAVQDARPEAEREADQQTLKAIGEAGRGEVVHGLRVAAPDLVDRSGSVPDAIKAEEDAKKELASARANPSDEDYGATIEGLERRLAKATENLKNARDKAALDLAASATLEHDYVGARKRLIEAIESNRAAFGPKADQLLADLKAIDAGLDPETARKGKLETNQDRIDAGAKGAEAAIAEFTKDTSDKAEAEADAQREGDRQNKASDQYFEQRVRQLAGPLQEGYNRSAAGGQAYDDERVQEQLVRGGLSEGGAERFAAKVREQLAEGFDEKVRTTAGERGLDQEGAKAAILQDANDKMLASARKSAEEAEEQRKEKALASLSRTDEGRGYRNILARSLMAGEHEDKADERASKHLAKQLQGEGMSERDARLEADRMVGEDSKRMREAMAETQAQFGRADWKQANEAPDRIASASFSAKVERAGADEGTKLQEAGNKLLEGLNRKMEELIRKPNVAVFGK